MLFISSLINLLDYLSQKGFIELVRVLEVFPSGNSTHEMFEYGTFEMKVYG